MDERFEYSVSDSMTIPLRGQLLRLKLLSGAPSVKAVAAGVRVRLRTPDGRERVIRILDHAITGGNVTRQRLDRTRELDIVVPNDDAAIDGESIGIGWRISGPVSD
ncbi:MAG: hypothetical protein WEE89_00990 [Gemmatimonadota bacterium]